MIRLRRADGGDELALPQDRNPVARAHDFVEFVRDENNRVALRHHRVEHFEQAVNFLRRQHRRRFV